MDNVSKGALCLILSSTSMAIMSVFVKLTGGSVPLMQQVFARNIVMLIFAAFMINRKGERYLPRKENALLLFLRSFFGFLALVCTFYATNNLDLGDAQALQKISPIFVSIFAVIFLGEEFTKVKLISLALAFIGALFVVRPSFSPRFFPALIGFLAAILSATAYTLLSFLQRKDNSETGYTIIFNFALLCCILSFPFMVKSYVGVDIKVAFLLLLIGVFAALGQSLMTKAYSLTDASNISIFDYTGVIMSTIFGVIIFNEFLPLASLLGIAIIILSGYISFKHNKDRN